MNPAECVVYFNAVPTARRVAQARQLIIIRSCWIVVILVGILIGYLFSGQNWFRAQIWVWLSLWAGVTVIMLGASIWSLLAAKHDLRNIGTGPAMVLSPAGIELMKVHVPWASVKAMKLAGVRIGSGPKLIVESVEGVRTMVPLSFLDTMPGTIDSAIRAYSLGRGSLDTRGLDSMV